MAFLDKMKNYLDKGVEVSKDAFSRAGTAVQDFGDKSVLRIEKKQFESKLEKEYISLGKQCFTLIKKDGEKSIEADDGRISGIIAEIERINIEIEKRDEQISMTKSEEPQKTESYETETHEDNKKNE